MSSSRNATRSGERGFGLIEILIALMVAILGFLAAGQLLYAVLGAATLARSQETTALAARNKMDDLSAIYLRNPAHEDLSPGNHGPQTVTTVNPFDDIVLNRHSITWTAGEIPDPRKDRTHAAILVRIRAQPVYNNNTPVNAPPSSGPIILTAVLSPEIP
jgi:type II secretory pathway pseudopilin PulG